MSRVAPLPLELSSASSQQNQQPLFDATNSDAKKTTTDEVKSLASSPLPPPSAATNAPPSSSSSSSSSPAPAATASSSSSSSSSSTATAPATATATAPTKPKLTPQQDALMDALLNCDLKKLYSDFNHGVCWQFTTKVIGRTQEQSPLSLLIRPELAYGPLSNISTQQQQHLILHALSLPIAFAPILDNMNHPLGGIWRRTMSNDVINCIYQGRVDILEILASVAINREKRGVGIAFNYRELYFPSQISLLHMACHDGRYEMARFIIDEWRRLHDAEPSNPLSLQFTPDLLDGAGQTPLFWVFARGPINVQIADYLVEQCQADFWRIIPLFKVDENGKYVMDDKKQRIVVGYASPFSLAIKVAPEFAAKQLMKQYHVIGSRFQNSVVKYNFTGITITQEIVDFISSHSADMQELRSNTITDASYTIMRKQLMLRDVNNLMHEADIPPIAPVKFVQPISGTGKQPIGRWDVFFYDASEPLTALEMMVKYRKKNLLLTPIMLEIQRRLWCHIGNRYYRPLLISYLLFGLCVAINTGIWPRSLNFYDLTSERDVENTTFSVVYMTTTIAAMLLSLLINIPLCHSIYSTRLHAFSTFSSKLDTLIFLVFWVMVSLQLSSLCAVPQWTSCSSHSLNTELLATQLWFVAIIHLLLGVKVMELLSMFEFVGPLLSTLLAMFSELRMFLQLFFIGFIAFFCALWPVLRDVPVLTSSSSSSSSSSSTNTTSSQPFLYNSYHSALSSVLLWIFLDIDYSIFKQSYLPSIAVLGRILFFIFMIFMVLILVNLMISMLVNKYSRLVNDGNAIYQLWCCRKLCQFLTQFSSSSSLQLQYKKFILEMACENNCGIDREQDEDDDDEQEEHANNLANFASKSSSCSSGGDASSDSYSTQNIQSHFMQVLSELKTVKNELRFLKAKMGGKID